MQINITGHHVDITDSIREAVKNKFNKLEKHFPNLTSLHVILTVEKHQQIAEVTTHFLGQDFAAKAASTDLYQAIGEMTAKLTSVMQRKKEKVKSHSHQKPDQLDQDDQSEESTAATG